MPETRGERIIFAIGALVIAALVALIVLETATDRFETRHTSAASKQVTTGAAIKDAAAQGSAKRFRSTHLWASFGSAANLTARLNGKPLHLPPGTYSALVGARGLKPLAG